MHTHSPAALANRKASPPLFMAGHLVGIRRWRNTDSEHMAEPMHLGERSQDRAATSKQHSGSEVGFAHICAEATEGSAAAG